MTPPTSILNIFKEYLQKYERHVGAVSILLGFIWDFFTFARPDQLLGNIILLSYLIGAALGIALLSLYRKRGEITPIILLALVQFAFGNIAGSFLFLYGKSGTFEGSSLFLLILGVFLIGNEFMREKYSKIIFHISVWYFLSLLYLTFVVPMVLGKMGDSVFFLSSVISLISAGMLLLVLHLTSKDIANELKKVSLYIGGIFVAFNAFYFLNIIPPVPLSLQEIGIYHLVERADNANYKTLYEKPEWYEFLSDTKKVFNKYNNESVYCFSSVFAPVKLSTGINHRWEHYDEMSNEWSTVSIVPFTITGGRDNGYRGYSQKQNLTPGRFRCSVETTTGALVGRTTFVVVNVTKAPVLLQKER
ncbi:MAG: DUF2914 domain-containing protein [Candidatus Paceibacterota bacterium]|jgi:hypothetical protein